MKAPLSRVPALPVAIGIIAGILSWNIGMPVWIATPIFAASIVLYLYKYHYTAFVLMMVSIGWLTACLNAPVFPPEYVFTGKHVYRGEVVSSKETGQPVRCIIKIDALLDDPSGRLRTMDPFRCMTTVHGLDRDYKKGDIVVLKASIQAIDHRLDLPHETDYQRYHYIYGVTCHASVAPDMISVAGKGKGVFGWFTNMRERLSDLIVSSPLDPGTSSFLVATILGDDTFLDDGFKDRFRMAGLAHVLALSGLHVGIIVLLISAALFPLKATRIGRSRHLFVIVAVWIYAMITGLSPSVTRAAVMVSVFLSARMMQRAPSPYNSLCLAAIAILVFDPNSLFAPGFQLSFTAVLSILFFAGRLNPVSRKHAVWHFIAEIPTVSMAAMIGTGLLCAYYFNRFPVWFLLANVIVTSLLPLLLGGGVLLIIFTSAGIHIPWMGCIIDWLYLSMDTVAGFASSLPYAEADGLFLSPWTVFLYFITIALVVAAMVMKRKILWIMPCVSAIITVCVSLLNAGPQPSIEVYVPRTTSCTNIIMRQGNHAYLLTTARTDDRREVLALCDSRYEGFLKSRKCGNGFELADDRFRDGCLYYNHPFLVIDGKVMMILSDDSFLAEPPVHVDYALICKGFKGDVTDAVKKISPDTLLLSRDLHVKRHDRYLRQCERMLPVRSLRDTCWKYVIYGQ